MVQKNNNQYEDERRVRNIEYIGQYIKRLESTNADIEQINRWKRLKKNMEEKKGIRETAPNMENNQPEDERTAFLNRMQAYSKQEETNLKVEEETIDEPIKEKRTLKNKVARFLVIGTLIGPPAILAYNLGYNYAVNMPSSHNYRTIKEAREGVEHDPTNHIKYLEQKGFSKEEIQKRLEEYEEDR